MFVLSLAVSLRLAQYHIRSQHVRKPALSGSHSHFSSSLFFFLASRYLFLLLSALRFHIAGSVSAGRTLSWCELVESDGGLSVQQASTPRQRTFPCRTLRTARHQSRTTLLSLKLFVSRCDPLCWWGGSKPTDLLLVLSMKACPSYSVSLSTT